MIIPRVSRLAIALAAAAMTAASLNAQTVSAPDSVITRDSVIATGDRFPLVTSEAVDRMRTGQLTGGVAEGQTLLLRSASTLSERKPAAGWRTAPIAPRFLFVNNSALPFSQNNGGLWAGKGGNFRVLLGLDAQSPSWRLILAPQILLMSNADWTLDNYYRPTPPADRAGGGYVFPYYIGPFSIDQPMRFGAKSLNRLDLGESSIIFSRGRISGGFSNENEWWGPGIRNAIVLSNNAPGFPHLFVRTARPLHTRFGTVEGRWLVGGLRESSYFDTVSTNNTRSLSSIAVTLQTAANPNLSFGAARSVYAVSTGWGQIPFRWLNVFTNTGHPAANAPPNSTETPGGRDQILSFFSRWVFPADGAEVYAEWARNELPSSLRELLVAPNHSQGYTVGFQWMQPSRGGEGIRLQGEITSLEQSATFRDRPLGSWYTSRKVIQGYTNRGEILGASIGPGASAQWLALDYIKPSWRIGGFAARTRWNEDVHSTAGFPDYVSYCNHDVSVLPGVRGARSGRLGSVTADLTLQNRMNAFFQNGGGCPNNGRRTDIRNTTLSVTFVPLQRR